MPRETEEQLYQRLHAKYGATKPAPKPKSSAIAESTDDDEPEYGDTIIIASGSKADGIISRLFGGDSKPADEDDEDDDEDDDDQGDEDDEDDDDEEEPEPDPEPSSRGPRYFQGRGKRS